MEDTGLVTVGEPYRTALEANYDSLSASQKRREFCEVEEADSIVSNIEESVKRNYAVVRFAITTMIRHHDARNPKAKLIGSAACFDGKHRMQKHMFAVTQSTGALLLPHFDGKSNHFTLLVLYRNGKAIYYDSLCGGLQRGQQDHLLGTARTAATYVQEAMEDEEAWTEPTEIEPAEHSIKQSGDMDCAYYRLPSRQTSSENSMKRYPASAKATTFPRFGWPRPRPSCSK